MKNLSIKSCLKYGAIALAFVSFNVLADSSGDEFKPSVARGAKSYNENCGRCHNPRPAEQYTARQWSVIMPHMRAKAHMTKQETLDVEAFLDSSLTQEKQGVASQSDSKPATADRGKALVTQFGCQGCHTINGEGGQMGPNLSHVFNNRNAEFVAKKLNNPSFNNPASAMPRFPLSKGDIDSIVQYLKSVAQ